MKKRKEKFTEDFKLVLMNGGTIIITVESEDENAIYEITAEARKKLEENRLWFVGGLIETSTVYAGNDLHQIDMRKVIGISY